MRQYSRPIRGAAIRRRLHLRLFTELNNMDVRLSIKHIFLPAFLILSLILPMTAPLAQTTDLPRVEMVIDNYDYMISLFPDDYSSRRQAIKACSTITTEADSLKMFWDEYGEYVLTYLSYYAGINWVEPEFDIYIVKYFPDYASYRPMTIPLAGKKNGSQIIAVPQGLSHYVTLFQQLARRLLDQAFMPGGSPYYIAGHPLMQKKPRRFGTLANLLALRTLADFKDIDSVMAVFRSAHWKQREPGHQVLLNNFWNKWELSGDSTLAYLIASEPSGSRLVALTRPPAVKRPQKSSWGNHQLQPPPGGKLGLSVARGSSGLFRVIDVDSQKLAYVSGLREDDLIRNIEGTAPRTIKQLFQLLLEHLDQGVHVNIIRNDEPDAVIIYPWEEVIGP